MSRKASDDFIVLGKHAKRDKAFYLEPRKRIRLPELSWLELIAIATMAAILLGLIVDRLGLCVGC